MSRSTVGKCSFIRAFIINVNAVHFKLKLFNYTDDWKPKYLKNYVTMHFWNSDEKKDPQQLDWQNAMYFVEKWNSSR